MLKVGSAVLSALVLLQACTPEHSRPAEPQAAQSPAPKLKTAPARPDDEIPGLLAKITAVHPGTGIVVGLIGPTGLRIFSRGVFDKNDQRPVGPDTEFELASVTKVFTSLVLADMVRHGEVALDDPAAKYLPGVKMPIRNGKQITLVDLATMTSGLPSDPPDAPDEESEANYGLGRLDAFLATYKLTRDPGAEWEYSNIGITLLARALASRAGKPFPTLFNERVAGPLGLKDTVFDLAPEQRSRLAPGHDETSETMPYAPVPEVLLGAGGLNSTANDMLKFLALELGPADNPLKDDLALLLSIDRPISPDIPDQAHQALGWAVGATKTLGPLINKEGGGFGYQSYLVYLPETGTGIVVLSNIFADDELGDFGDYLLGAIKAWPCPPSTTTGGGCEVN
ncbi:MAG TPA: serine hydrolase domain-containing protein [Hyphomonadaceae bacterium]|jgi:CubicO group peptidase (beta-lactamase class C family)|nr:serine hydrolase domain-containing protein [Hyphomonadaceae bacterium]